MKLNGIDLKYMTKEEVNDFEKLIKCIENDPVIKCYIEGVYGSIENYGKLINGEINNTKKEYQKQEMEKKKEAYENYINNWYNPLSIKKANNINKKCKIKNHSFIKDGTEGVIKDVVKEAEQYVVIIGESNINYINFENIDIIDEWKDIIIKGYNEDYGDYSIIFTKDIIKIIFFDDWFEDNEEYELNLSQDIRETLINNINKNKSKVIEYILNTVKYQNSDEKYKSIKEQIKKLELEKEKLNIKCVNQDDILESLLKELK